LVKESIMSENVSRFDAWINEGGPSALILKEYLEPASGPGDVIFPPTFAPPEDKRGEPAGYIIDGAGDKAVCLIDSVGSQANRLEPIFKGNKYNRLVPQIEISVKDRKVNLLDVGHRAADALIRSTELGATLENAFIQQREAGNALPLAKIAPTTIIFGAWDSRGSQAKVPRLIDSTIRAFGVTKLSRSAQYFSALEKDEVEELLETDTQKQRKPLSKAGFLDAPSGLSHGGIMVSGDIVRTTVVNLTALRALGAPTDEESRTLRRYILALTLIAAFAPGDLFLRQGCLLVRSPKPPQSTVVFRDGRREPFVQQLSEIELFAKAASAGFAVGEDRSVHFDAKIAKELVKKASKIKEEA
jgi:CRISPR-associated protein Csb1